MVPGTAYKLRTQQDLISYALNILMHRENIQVKAQLCNMTLEIQLPSLFNPYLSSPPAPLSSSQSPMHPSSSHIKQLLSSLTFLWLCLCGITCPECPVPSQVTSACSRLTSIFDSSGKPPLTMLPPDPRTVGPPQLGVFFHPP